MDARQIHPKTIMLSCPFKALSIFSIVRYQPFTLGTYTYPTWSLVLTWSVSLIPVICIPIGMAHSLYKAEGASIYE
ncbi:hypothetical protein KUTeg_015214, partial [Tegillarca granosa]